MDGGEKVTEEGDHRHLTEGNLLDLGFIDYGEQVGQEIRGVSPGAGNEVDEGLNYLIFGGGGLPETGVKPKRGAEK